MLIAHSRLIICFLFVSLWLSARCYSEDIRSDSLSVGATAPNWMMIDIEGQSHSLYNELDGGRDVVMVFWASWCKFCRDLMPELNLFKQSLANNSIRFFAMNIWEDGDPVGYFDGHNIKLPLILKADAIARRYNIKGTPGVVLIGRDKRIRYVRAANEDTNTTIRNLQRLLLERYQPDS